MMKRIFDVVFSLVALCLYCIPIIFISLMIMLTSKGPIIYWSNRVGKDNAIFRMPKFRTMRIDTPAVATHLLNDPDRYLTPVGKFLRKSSLDELPQLWSVLKGDMSFVGPRPALFNQDDLIALRTVKGGRDDLPIPVKVKFDVHYLENRSLIFDIKILFLTLLKVLRREGVTH